MGRIVYASATSHVGAIIKDPHVLPQQSAKLHEAWSLMDEQISALQLDTVIILATDHYETFGLGNYPTYCLGVGEKHEGWGEFGNPTGTIRGAPELGMALLDRLMRHGFDLSRSLDMRLDHSFMVPLTKLTAASSTAVLPLFVNCNTPPLPSLQRCFDLGIALARAVEELPAQSRVGVVGTGGISHWVGLPRFGDINENFDRNFLGLVTAGEVDEILSWSDDWVLEVAGNGALEIRTWLMALGAARGSGGTLLAYQPMYPWATGIGIVRFHLETETA